MHTAWGSHCGLNAILRSCDLVRVGHNPYPLISDCVKVLGAQFLHCAQVPGHLPLVLAGTVPRCLVMCSQGKGTVPRC